MIGEVQKVNKSAAYVYSRKRKSEPGCFEDVMTMKKGAVDKEDYKELLQEKQEEIREKIKNGETEASYQIGANSYTESQWDKVLENFDDVTEEMRELMREEYEKRYEEELEKRHIMRKQMIEG